MYCTSAQWCNYFCFVLCWFCVFSGHTVSRLTALPIMSYLSEPQPRTGRSTVGIIFNTIHCQGKLVQWVMEKESG